MSTENAAGDVIFYPSDGKTKLLATTRGGHTLAISPDGTPVPKQFHRDAMLAGCVPKELMGKVHIPINAETGDQPEGDSKVDIVVKAITSIMEEIEVDPTKQAQYLTGDKIPNATVLTTRCGFAVSGQLRDEAWDIYNNSGDD